MLDPYYFYFELPLYTRIQITNANLEEYFSLVLDTSFIDGYNPVLKENTTYRIQNRGHRYGRNRDISTHTGYFEMELSCVRINFIIKYYIKVLCVEDEESDVNNYYISKVGQYPSIADLHISRFKEYDKVIDRKYLKDITRAIGLAANGVGIGSYVYLRRVFEFLIDEAYQEAKKDVGWNDDLYKSNKVVEKIELLKNHLPQFLIKNKSIYSILSLGLHQLEEQECLKYFEPLKVGIELILDEKVDTYKKKKKIEEAELKIQQITKLLKN